MRRILLSAVLFLFTLVFSACAASAGTRREPRKTPIAKSSKVSKAKTAKAKPAKAKVKKAKGEVAAKKSRRVPRYHLSLHNVNTRERADNLRVVEVVTKGKKKVERLAKGVKKRLARLMRDVRSGKSKEAPERLVWQFYRTAQHFDAPVHIISGYRGSARKTSRHHRAFAVDFRVEGVTPKKVWEWCKRFKNTGCGYYPTSGFVHMDVREKSYAWIDYSGPGEPARYEKAVSQAKPPARRGAARR